LSEEKRTKGQALVSKLFGLPAGQAPAFPEPFGRYTVEHLFGDVWQQDDLTLQERSLATCTMLFALNRPEEMQLHFTGARNVGVERQKLLGVIAHGAHYAGWPNAMAALRVLNEVWPESE